MVTLSGTGGPGSAVVLNTTAIGSVVGSCNTAGPTFCTDADPYSARGMPAWLPSVTGAAHGEMFNINQTNGDTLCACPPGLTSCDISQCTGPITINGSPMSSCNQLTGVNPSASGLGLAGAFAVLSQPTIDDVLVTTLMEAQ